MHTPKVEDGGDPHHHLRHTYSMYMNVQQAGQFLCTQMKRIYGRRANV